ncbi:hypothetical protein GCM10028775_06130 [Catellatospora paridis]
MTTTPALETRHPVDFEPSWLGQQTYLSRRRPMKIDAAVVLSVTICLLTLIPSRLVLPGLTGLGRPAMVLAIMTVAWWILVKLSPRLVMRGRQPIRWIALLLLVDMLVSYAVGYGRGLTMMEANSADRWMLQAAAMCGLMLLASDGISNWERLKAVLKAFVWCAAFMAVVGVLQSFLALDITTYFVIPGLREGAEAADIVARGGGIRVASTATHYIEFSVVMALALPFGIHFAAFAPTSKARQTYWALAGLIAIAIPLTISRTGIICAVLAMLVVASVWTWRLRYNLFVIALVFGAVLAGTKPSLVGTLLWMFTGASEDPSITSRTDRYQMVLDFFVQRPWFGRGTGTWVWPQYQYLDNQWFATALENGIVGVAALASLHICAIVLVAVAWRRSKTAADRHLAAALMSTQITAIAASATFDSLSFTTYVVLIAILVGLCGAVWRLTHPERLVRTASVSVGKI